MFVMNRFHFFIIRVTWKVNLLDKGVLIFVALILTIQCRITRLYYTECSTKILSYIVRCVRDIRSKTLWPRQNSCNCTDDTFKFIWLNGNIYCWFLFHWTLILGVQLTISLQIIDSHWTATSHFLNLHQTIKPLKNRHSITWERSNNLGLFDQTTTSIKFL